MSQDPWFADGVRFDCTSCGRCCRRTGVVAFLDDDVTRAASHLGLTEDAFRAKHLEHQDGHWFVDVYVEHPCHFLSTEGLCTIHEAKPLQCSSYPFWPELFEEMNAWDAEQTYCEGINQGTLRPLDEILDRMIE